MIKQVTSVGATASTIVTPSGYTKILTIQNNGSGNVRLSIDGVTAPTATTGYKLAANGVLTLLLDGGFTQPPVKAILESATTTTLDIVTDDIQAT